MTLSDDEFAKVAPNGTRVTLDEAADLLSAPSGQRPRVYGYWVDQIVAIRSVQMLDHYASNPGLIDVWVSNTTVNDLIERAR